MDAVSLGESPSFTIFLEKAAAKLLFCIIHSLITIVFVTSWPEAKLADVIAVEKKLTGR